MFSIPSLHEEYKYHKAQVTIGVYDECRDNSGIDSMPVLLVFAIKLHYNH